MNYLLTEEKPLCGRCLSKQQGGALSLWDSNGGELAVIENSNGGALSIAEKGVEDGK